MAVQVRLDNSNLPLIRQGYSWYKNGIIAQNAQRDPAAPLVPNTIMAYNSSSLQWVPWTDVAGLNGTAYPIGVYVGDEIDAADIIAGAIADCPILVGGCLEIDEAMLVYDNGTYTRNTVVTAMAMSCEVVMRLLGFMFIDTTDNTEHEN